MSIVSAQYTTIKYQKAKANIYTAQARGMVTEVDHPTCGPMELVSPPVKFSHSQPSIRTPPPTLGQHTDELLTEMLGMKPDEVEALKSKGVIS